MVAAAEDPQPEAERKEPDRAGRLAPAVALFWAPLFSVLIAAANRGLAPSAASAMLMAFASLLLIAALADIVVDVSEKAGFPRAAAHS